jgi:hypothetical protein
MLAALIHFLVLARQLQDASRNATPDVTVGTLRWTIPLSELLERLASSVRTYRVRRFEPGSIDPISLPRAIQDGLVWVYCDGTSITVEEVLEARDKESPDLFPRRKIERFDIPRGETCSSLFEMGWVRPSIYLYCPCPVPIWIYYLQGLVDPDLSAARLLSDVESRSAAGCREATFLSPSGDSIRSTYALDDAAHLLRIEIERKNGCVETITYVGSSREPRSSFDAPLAVLRTLRQGETVSLVELWTRVESDRTSADASRIPPYAALLDLRGSEDSVHDILSDRESTMSAVFDSDTSPVAPAERLRGKQTIVCSSESSSEDASSSHSGSGGARSTWPSSGDASHTSSSAATLTSPSAASRTSSSATIRTGSSATIRESPSAASTSVSIRATPEILKASARRLTTGTGITAARCGRDDPPPRKTTISLTDFERNCLALAGIQADEPAPSFGQSIEHVHRFASTFEIPGFFRCSITHSCGAGRPLFAFEPIGEQNEALDAIDKCSICGCMPSATPGTVDPYFRWIARHLRSRLEPSEPALSFEQLDASENAVATMRFRRRCASKHSLEITAFLAGCGVELLEKLPIVVGDAPVELHFRCSISRPRPVIGNRVVRFELGGEPSLVMPMIIDVPRPRLVASPAELVFEEDGAAEVDLELTPLGLHMQSIEIVRVPPCVELTTTTARSDHALIHVSETALAERHHACRTLLALVKFADSDHPETIRIAIHHRRPERDASGALCLRGEFMPGEALILYRGPSGDYSIGCPDRVPCGPELMDRAGFTAVASTKVPTKEGTFDWRFGGSDAAPPIVHLQGRASAGIGSCMSAWMKIGQ